MGTMRIRTPKVVITFATTADAMAIEAAAKEHDDVPGRMIPVPSAIDAGCGFAWRCEPDQEPALFDAMARYGLAYEGRFEVPMY
ncbi:MAG: DUF3343 domain-containing protein [Eggerthellaceae bacterium]|jgi:hypothetical protein